MDILGSFFPAWLICLLPAILLTFATQQALSRLHKRLALPALAYLSLAMFFTLVLWAVFFY